MSDRPPVQFAPACFNVDQRRSEMTKLFASPPSAWPLLSRMPPTLRSAARTAHAILQERRWSDSSGRFRTGSF